MEHTGLKYRFAVIAACCLGLVCITYNWGSPAQDLWVSSTSQSRVPIFNARATSSDNALPSYTAEVPARQVTTDVNEGSAENYSLETIENDLEEMGTTFTTAAAVAFPLVAAMGAIFTGLFLRKVLPNAGSQLKDALQPMDMAANEEAPLNRRGMLAALSSMPLLAASPAFAAKSGGRLGGSSFRSFSRTAPPPPPRPQPQMGGMAGAGRTVIVTPPPVVVAPASPFGYGMAPAMPYGFGFSTGELLALSAVELGQAFVREQQRQAFIQQQLETQRKLGRDEAQIEALQQQLASQEQRMRDLQMAMNQKGVPAPAQ